MASAHPILRGEETVTLRRDLVRRKDRPPARAQVADEDAALFSALKAKRRALAEAQSVPAYVIFPDRTLAEMAARRPETLDDMATVSGVGAKKLQSYGQAFLDVIAMGGAEVLHPARRALAGQPAGAIMDRLAEAARDLARGEDGTGKLLDCNARLLAAVARARPHDMAGLARLMGEARAERFGPAFLAVLAEAG